MSKLTIRTNNHWNNFLYGNELTKVEKQEFDYIDPSEIDSHDFFRYRGHVYDPNEFMRCPDNSDACNSHSNNLGDWQGYQSDSFFSGIVIRYSEDYEQYQVGTYYS